MQTLRKGSRNPDAVVMLQELLNRAGQPIGIDGVFGQDTDTAVREYQKASGLVVDGIVGEQTWLRLMADAPAYAEERSNRFLTEEDLLQAAAELGVELAAIKAVTEVEAGGHGFVGGKPKILFEGHVFWKRLMAHGLDPAACRAGNEDILYPRWSREHYVGGVREHERLDRAREIHEDAALESASWGLFQIMGFQWRPLGYRDVQDYARRMAENEGEQLEAFTKFVRADGLVRYLKELRWAGFARRYNGPAYKENHYDEKLERAYRRYAA
jgi:hypothetical protein